VWVTQCYAAKAWRIDRSEPDINEEEVMVKDRPASGDGYRHVD